MRLTKHHGLGNDFLVLLDPEREIELTADLARTLCDRHRGVGADGMIRVTPAPAGADVSMELRNADGGPAEMSGNGIRCLGQAVALDRGARQLDLVVATAVGPRRLRVSPGPGPRTVEAEVDMGVVKVDPDRPEWTSVSPDATCALVDVGNPHVVILLDALGGMDVAGEGARLDGGYPGGVNVEFATPNRNGGGLTMRVWERGVGLTEACGTGAVAVVAVARELGWIGAADPVRVDMPGGSVEVALGETATLTGPSVHVADVEVPWP